MLHLQNRVEKLEAHLQSAVTELKAELHEALFGAQSDAYFGIKKSRIKHVSKSSRLISLSLSI